MAFAGYLSTIIEAAVEQQEVKELLLRDISVEEPLLFKPKETRLLQTVLESTDEAPQCIFA